MAYDPVLQVGREHSLLLMVWEWANGNKALIILSGFFVGVTGTLPCRCLAQVSRTFRLALHQLRLSFTDSSGSSWIIESKLEDFVSRLTARLQRLIWAQPPGDLRIGGRLVQTSRRINMEEIIIASESTGGGTPYSIQKL